MTLTDILLAEHHHIERLISLFGIVTGDFSQGQPVQPDFFIEAGRFIQVYVDGQHHRKEEGILFPAIAPYMAKAVEALLAEHELARGFTRGMMGSASAWKNGDETAAQETIKEARSAAPTGGSHAPHFR